MNALDLAGLSTYDPDRDTPGTMERRDTYRDGDYYMVEDVQAALARATVPAPDPVVEANRQLLLDRSRVGVEKYGTTLAGAGLSRNALIRHALEEALDLSNYLQSLLMLADDDAEQAARLERAERALLRAGFVDHGGEDWTPPLGPRPPAFADLAESMRDFAGGGAHIEALSKATTRPYSPTYQTWDESAWRWRDVTIEQFEAAPENGRRVVNTPIAAP